MGDLSISHWGICEYLLALFYSQEMLLLADKIYNCYD